MSVAAYGATSVQLTCHTGERAGMADVEQRDRSGYTSGAMALDIAACRRASYTATTTSADLVINFGHFGHFLGREQNRAKAECIAIK